jgi:hypothetical protein
MELLGGTGTVRTDATHSAEPPTSAGGRFPVRSPRASRYLRVARQELSSVMGIYRQ